MNNSAYRLWFDLAWFALQLGLIAFYLWRTRQVRRKMEAWKREQFELMATNKAMRSMLVALGVTVTIVRDEDGFRVMGVMDKRSDHPEVLQ